jgi:RimJ/RimL family protein N-acetyltransferase
LRGLRRAPLEEARFGIRTARAEEVTAEDLPALLDFCGEESVQLLIARCDASDLCAAQALEEGGARLMDTIVYWERDLAKRPPEEGLADPRVRPATRSDEAAVIAIAQESFAGYYGHYHADRRLDRAATDAAYVDWAARSLSDPSAADTVMVAEVEGAVSAFGTLKIESDGRCNYILAAVAASAGRLGLYRAIAATGIEWAAARGAPAFYSSTQIGNLAVQKVWARLGMELSGAVNTFHWWRP